MAVPVWRKGVKASPRDVGDVDLFGFNWAPILVDPDVVIVASAWTVDDGTPAGAEPLEVDASGTVDGQATRTTVSGGSAGAEYVVTNTITTAELPARTLERSFRVPTANL